MHSLLKDGAAALGVDLDNKMIEQYFEYMAFLKEYNQKVNLTRITEDREVIIKHFLDSLTLSKFIPLNARLVDIGTGAGFPGLALKIARPDISPVLLDGTNKRVTFLKELMERIGVTAEAIHGRAEELNKSPSMNKSFDIATCRAVASLSKLIPYALPFLRVKGELLSQKSVNYHQELEEAAGVLKKYRAKVEDIVHVTLPESDIEHCIIRIAVT